MRRRFAARRAAVLVTVLLLVATVVLVVGPSLFPLAALPVLMGAVFFCEAGAVSATLGAGLVLALTLRSDGAGTTDAAGVEALVALAVFAVAGLAVARLQRGHRAHLEVLAASSLTDRLTGLYTFGTFVDYLRNEVRKAERYGGEVCLIMVDLDHFKRFNDRYGHQLGNELLRRVGATLRGHVREADMAARYGGEEFALLIRGGEREGLELAERVRGAIGATGVPLPDGRFVFATASAGVAGYPVGALDERELVERADRALYASKRRGRDHVTLASDLAAGQRRATRTLTA